MESRLCGRSTFSTFAGAVDAGVALVGDAADGEAIDDGGDVATGGVEDAPPHETSHAEQAIHREFMRAIW